MTELKLQSGSSLMIGVIPFSEAKNFYQAVLEEMRSVAFASKSEMGDIIKNFFCAGFSSKKIESALWVCLSRCTYNGLKIEEKTFEPMDAREDFTPICIEVALEVVRPFAKGLSAGLSRISMMMPSSPV